MIFFFFSLKFIYGPFFFCRLPPLRHHGRQRPRLLLSYATLLDLLLPLRCHLCRRRWQRRKLGERPQPPLFTPRLSRLKPCQLPLLLLFNLPISAQQLNCAPEHRCLLHPPPLALAQPHLQMLYAPLEPLLVLTRNRGRVGVDVPIRNDVLDLIVLNTRMQSPSPAPLSPFSLARMR